MDQPSTQTKRLPMDTNGYKMDTNGSSDIFNTECNRLLEMARMLEYALPKQSLILPPSQFWARCNIALMMQNVSQVLTRQSRIYVFYKT